MLKFKIIVAGAKEVGKTSLIHRYVSGSFSSDTLSTIGVDFMTSNIEVDGVQVHFSIWDFAGENRFRQLFPSYCSGASGALMLFDVTDKSSFDDLTDWINLIDNSSNSIMKILVAAKVDLEEKRKISQEKAKEFVKDHNLELYLETSAKTGKGVNDVFVEMARIVIQKSLRKCPKCGELIAKAQMFCMFCGQKLEIQ